MTQSMVNPANTKHLHNICTTSAQRLRRWSNIVQMLYKCFVFAGKMIQSTSVNMYRGVMVLHTYIYMLSGERSSIL